MNENKSPRYFDATTLNSFGLTYSTDKSSRAHDYLRFYEFFFQKFRNDDFTLLELGVGPEKNKGKSLLTWRDYFPNAKIVGVDIRPDAKTVETERICVEIGDLSEVGFLSRIAEKYPSNKIVIDDASHLWSHQITSFENLFSTVEAGGIFVVEDLHTSFSPLSERFYAAGPEDAYSYFSKLAYLVCGKGNKHSFLTANPPTSVQITLANQIEAMNIYRKTMVIIKK